MTDQRQVTARAAYELRVEGELGPLLLSALPHAVAVEAPKDRVTLTVAADDKDLVRIIGLMVAVGLEVESVR